jgi:hypothetical protein
VLAATVTGLVAPLALVGDGLRTAGACRARRVVIRLLLTCAPSVGWLVAHMGLLDELGEWIMNHDDRRRGHAVGASEVLVGVEKKVRSSERALQTYSYGLLLGH